MGARGIETDTRVDPVGPRTRPGPTRATRSGLVVMLLGPVVAALGDPAALVWAAPMIVVPGIVLVLVSRAGRWAHAVAAVVGVLGLLAALPGAWVLTAAPDSVLDVVPTVMVAVGGVVAIVGGTAGALGRWEARLARVRPVALGVVGVAALGSGTLALVGGADVDDAVVAAAVEVRVDERGYTPAELALRPGERVTLALRNDGRIAHTFTSDALDVDVVLSPGEVVLAEVEVPADLDGRQYWCTPHSRETEDGSREWMVGDLAAAR